MKRQTTRAKKERQNVRTGTSADPWNATVPETSRSLFWGIPRWTSRVWGRRPRTWGTRTTTGGWTSDRTSWKRCWASIRGGVTNRKMPSKWSPRNSSRLLPKSRVTWVSSFPRGWFEFILVCNLMDGVDLNVVIIVVVAAGTMKYFLSPTHSWRPCKRFLVSFVIYNYFHAGKCAHRWFCNQILKIQRAVLQTLSSTSTTHSQIQMRGACPYRRRDLKVPRWRISWTWWIMNWLALKLEKALLLTQKR